MAHQLKAVLLVSAASAACVWSAPVLAQDGQTDARDGAVQEIVVTAQRRAENLQDVPIAITALGGEELTALGVVSTADLLAVTPGLNYTAAAGVFAQPKIRGIGTSSNGPGIENPVATYIDGVYFGSMSGSLLNLADIEQVAVLRGPQGTLFGRNSTGGLIQITTRRPRHDTAMNFSVGYGNLDTFTASAYVNGGITDTIAANASVYYQNRGDGFGTNIFNGEDVFRSSNIAARAKLLWEPGPGTDILLSGDYSRVRGALNGQRHVPGAFNALGLQATGGRYDVNQNIQPDARLEQAGGSLTVVQELGSLELQSITAYRDTLNRTELDFDKTPVPLTNVRIRIFDQQFSQELQLQPQRSGALQWILGGYYFWAKSGYDGNETNGNNIPNGITQIQNSSQTVNSFAGYAQGTLARGENTNVTAGLRYTTDLRRVDARSDAVLPNGVIANTQVSTGSRRFSQLTWRLSLDHRFSPELLGYASYNRGFKSGAYLLQNFPSTTLEPEVLDAFEVGIKSDLFDRRVRFNLAAFYYDYTNIQIQLINRGQLTAYSGAGATLYGLDADLVANVTDNLTLNAGVSWLHHEYKAFDAFIATPITPVFPPPVGRPNGGNLITTGDVAGNRLQAAPDFTLNIGGNYRIDLGRDRIDLSANYYYNDGWYAEADNRLRQGSYNTVNASIAYTTANDHLTVSLWGRNLTNAYYASFLSSADVGDTITPAEGHTYGVTLSTRF